MLATRRCTAASTTVIGHRQLAVSVRLATRKLNCHRRDYHLTMATPDASTDEGAGGMGVDQAYDAALARLAQLQSNRAVTSLFDTSPLPSSSSTTTTTASSSSSTSTAATAAASAGAGRTAGAGAGVGPAADLNALAIPEMLAWLRRAGYTPESLAASPLRCVHVAGTKGKGSVSALVGGILGEYRDVASSSSPSSSSSPARSRGGWSVRDGDGRKDQGDEAETGAEEQTAPVGLYTSPHVVSVRERIALGGRPISRAKFARYVGEVWDRLTEAARAEVAASRGGAAELAEAEERELAGPATKPFYFRFLTLVALHAFLREGVRDAVVECGIGGEYDATNVLPAGAVTAAVVTQLGIDHVGMLGSTAEEIAWHKSGVFRPGVRAFTRRLPGAAQRGVMEVLRARAREKGAALVEVADEDVEAWGGVEGARLQGPFQKYNMVLAVHAAREHLLRTGRRFEGRFGTDAWSLADIPPEFVRGLRTASLRGRCETLEDGDGTEWHLDGAHTDDSLAGVGRWFAGRIKDEGGAARVLVFNQQERDVSGLLRALLTGAHDAAALPSPLFTHAIFTRNEEHRPADGEDRDISVQNQAVQAMQDIAEAKTQTVVYDAVQAAIDHVREIAVQARREGKKCKVLVTGSFHLVGAVLKTIDHVEY